MFGHIRTLPYHDDIPPRMRGQKLAVICRDREVRIAFGIRDDDDLTDEEIAFAKTFFREFVANIRPDNGKSP